MLTRASRLGGLRRPLLVMTVLLWVGAFVATHVPAETIPQMHVSDKWLHFMGFLVLAAALHLTLVVHGIGRWRRVAATLLSMAAYAALDERTQPLVNRSCSPTDAVADLCGAIAAVVALELVLVLTRGLGRAAHP